MSLSEQFIAALLDGHLSALHNFVQNDLSLCPEIRIDTLTVYYRGGSLLKLKEVDGTYQASFDIAQYAAAAGEPWAHWWVTGLGGLPETLNTPEEVQEWLMRIPFLKSVMDRYFVDHAWRERDAQQRIVLENNRDGNFANSTDYCFCDMEVAENQGAAGGLRADLIGVEWHAPKRRRRTNQQLVVAEVKYGVDALENLVEHYQDLHALMNDPPRLNGLKTRMLTAFQQKHRLRFIQTKNPLEGFSDSHVTWLLVLINHNPRSELLRIKLGMLNQFLAENADDRIEVRVATSNFMGYGLWTHAVLDLAGFLRTYDSQIGP